MTACPVCTWPDGFHDADNKQGKHASREVPGELLLESGWQRKKETESELLVNVHGLGRRSLNLDLIGDNKQGPEEVNLQVPVSD